MFFKSIDRSDELVDHLYQELNEWSVDELLPLYLVTRRYGIIRLRDKVNLTVFYEHRFGKDVNVKSTSVSPDKKFLFILTTSPVLCEVHVLYIADSANVIDFRLYKLYETEEQYDDIGIDEKYMVIANLESTNRKIHQIMFSDLLGIDFYESVR